MLLDGGTGRSKSVPPAEKRHMSRTSKKALWGRMLANSDGILEKARRVCTSRYIRGNPNIPERSRYRAAGEKIDTLPNSTRCL